MGESVKTRLYLPPSKTKLPSGRCEELYRLIGEKPGLSQSDMARRLGVTRQRVYELMKILEQQERVVGVTGLPGKHPSSRSYYLTEAETPHVNLERIRLINPDLAKHLEVL